jgi:hypothetical protein
MPENNLWIPQADFSAYDWEEAQLYEKLGRDPLCFSVVEHRNAA